MKAAPPLELNPVTETKSATQTIAHPRATTGFGTQQHSTAKTKTTSAVAQKGLPELTTFRALTRQVFGAEAGREYFREAVLFVCMMVVAAWPLSITLDMLGTMMISPPAW